MPDQEQRHEMHAGATRVSQAHPSEVGTEWSTWRPLRLPIFRNLLVADLVSDMGTFMQGVGAAWLMVSQGAGPLLVADRKSTRLNSSHQIISYAVFCLKKKNYQ